MNSKVIIIIILALLSFRVPLIWTQCNVCSNTTLMACVSETQYQFCINSIPTGGVNTCPTDYICTTTTDAICQPTSAGLEASCSNCNVCNAIGIFACTGVHTYALCLNSSIVSPLTGSCGASLVCNWDLPEICGDPTMGEISPTCPTAGESVTSTTPSLTTPATLPTYAQFLCQQIRINGRFSFPLEVDNTCKRYIYCFLTTSSTWSGQIYTCAGSTYFDPNSRYCVATAPTGCNQ